MSICLDKLELLQLSNTILTSKIGDISDQIVKQLRDRIVEQVQADVLAKIDLPTIVNLANIRAGVKLGERIVAEATSR